MIPSTSNPIQKISQILFETEIQIHILHLQAVNKSYAVHIALGSFYDSLGDLNDDLVEKSYAKYGLCKSYKGINLANDIDPISYIKKNMVPIESERENIKYGYLQQIVDNVLEQFAHVLYKLENLK